MLEFYGQQFGDFKNILLNGTWCHAMNPQNRPGWQAKNWSYALAQYFPKIAAKFDEYTMYHYKTTNRVTINHKKSL